MHNSETDEMCNLLVSRFQNGFGEPVCLPGVGCAVFFPVAPGRYLWYTCVILNSGGCPNEH